MAKKKGGQNIFVCCFAKLLNLPSERTTGPLAETPIFTRAPEMGNFWNNQFRCTIILST
jgi:hypothetical protein